jgi:hypothetical protein
VKKSPSIVIKIADDCRSNFDSEATYTMMESMIFFDAVHPVLKSLERFGQKGDLPFPTVFQGKSREVDIPRYLRDEASSQMGAKSMKYMSITPVVTQKKWNISCVFPGSSEGWDILNKEPFPSTPAYVPLDKSQRDAIKLALSHELAIIQGPPGKTCIPFLHYIYNFLSFISTSFRPHNDAI